MRPPGRPAEGRVASTEGRSSPRTTVCTEHGLKGDKVTAWPRVGQHQEGPGRLHGPTPWLSVPYPTDDGDGVLKQGSTDFIP